MELVNNYVQCMRDKIAECQKMEQEYIADNKKDEADFYKIRANIYDIGIALIQAAGNEAGKSKGTETEQREILSTSFLNKMDKIPASWRAALVKAEEHQDTARAVIEKIKLETADEMIKLFKKMA